MNLAMQSALSIFNASSVARVLAGLSGLCFGSYAILKMDWLSGLNDPKRSAQRNMLFQLGTISALGATYLIAPDTFLLLLHETWGMGKIALMIASGGILGSVLAAVISYSLGNKASSPIIVHRILDSVFQPRDRRRRDDYYYPVMEK